MPALIDKVLRRLRHRMYVGREPAKVFGRIYADNAWQGSESVSGRGSDLDQTASLRANLPTVLGSLSIGTLLDVPCGDFNWMRHVVESLPSLTYLGGDIVPNLVARNRSLHATDRIAFDVLDLATSTLPSADMLFCRDCLVHLSFDVIGNVIENIRRSPIKYIALTTFTGRTTNVAIRTGEWRPLNLEVAPFCFPKPLALLNEGCTEENGTLADKCIGIWAIDDVRSLA
jgi:hypothetical protein